MRVTVRVCNRCVTRYMTVTRRLDTLANPVLVSLDLLGSVVVVEVPDDDETTLAALDEASGDERVRLLASV